MARSFELKSAVAAITEARMIGVFAITQSNLFRFCDLKRQWYKLCALMGTITERLIGGLAATAPVVSSGLQF